MVTHATRLFPKTVNIMLNHTAKCQLSDVNVLFEIFIVTFEIYTMQSLLTLFCIELIDRDHYLVTG